jgi:riboflavin-specific deaminase-like protein
MGPDEMEGEKIASRLWPRLLARAEAPARLGAAAAAFWGLYAPIADGRADAMVLGQLGQSLDGRIATATGHSHYVNGPAAIDHLHRLRALVDAVVVGIGTVLADDPQLTVRRVSGPHPARVVIDPNGRLPATSRVLAEDGRPVFVIQGAERHRPRRVTPITLPISDGRLAPLDIIAALAERGLRRILIEGGADTLSCFLAAGALDRLHLCVAPLVIGSGRIGIALPPIDRLECALRPAVTVHRLGDDMLFDCCFR